MGYKSTKTINFCNTRCAAIREQVLKKEKFSHKSTKNIREETANHLGTGEKL
jgi:hypothetical protein